MIVNITAFFIGACLCFYICDKLPPKGQAWFAGILIVTAITLFGISFLIG